jgi:glycosyltransferase involved in cell wall biosynthesis
VRLVSNVHELSPTVAPWDARRGLVFIGGFQHPPNVDAVLWYARQVLPIVRRRLPGVKTYVIGSQMSAAVKALATDDLAILGHVPDVAPYFSGCRVSISPLRYGAGVKGKVNLAMSYGLPVVATPASVEGMHLTDGEDVLVAGDAEAFAAAVAGAPTRTARCGRSCRRGAASTSSGTSRAPWRVRRCAICSTSSLGHSE